MILDLLGAFIILLFFIAWAWLISMAFTFWYIAVPLVLFLLYVVAKRGQEQAKIPISARAQANLDMFRAREDMYRRIAKENKRR